MVNGTDVRGQKYYTVWVGRKPGVYKSWEECLDQVRGFKGAKYRAYSNERDAWEAILHSPRYNKKLQPKELLTSQTLDGPRKESWSVDAACSGNPGYMEYRGVDNTTGKEIFHFGPIEPATNNIGEFLAIVHALALQARNGTKLPIYSDSSTAIAWIRRKRCCTTMQEDSRNERVFKLIRRAEKWLDDNKGDIEIIKWDTRRWGEITADFGRK